MDKCSSFFFNYSSSVLNKKITSLFELLVLLFYLGLDWVQLLRMGLLQLFEFLCKQEILQSGNLILLLGLLLLLDTCHAIFEKLWDQIVVLRLQICQSIKCQFVLLTAFLPSWRMLRYNIIQLLFKFINLLLDSHLCLFMVLVQVNQSQLQLCL